MGSNEDLHDYNVRKHPNAAWVYYDRAMWRYFYNGNDYPGAIEDFTKAIELKSDDKLSYYGRGKTKSLLKDYRGAIEDFTKTIELAPDFKDAYSERGNNKSMIEDNQGASTDYKKASELRNKEDERNKRIYASHYESAMKKYVLRDYQGALCDFTWCIDHNHAPGTFTQKDSAEVHIYRGATKFELSDIEGAMKDLNKGIELKPDSTEAYCYRSRAKYALYDFHGALIDQNKAIELKPDSPENYKYRGDIKCRFKDYSGALIDYNKAIELKPSYSEAYKNRGLAKIGLGDKNGGCLDFSKAGELGFFPAYDLIKKHCNKKRFLFW